MPVSLAMDLGLVQQNPYTLLLHSLLHEHNSKNYNRHVLLFQKWSRDCSHGLYIQDLADIIEVLKTLRSRYIMSPSLFGSAVLNILSNLLTKPLLERKAHERKSQNSQRNMKLYLLEIFKLFECSADDHNDIKVEVIECLRQLILNNSLNSTDNKVPQIIEDNDKYRDGSNYRKVADSQWIQSILNESGLFNLLSESFAQIIQRFEIHIQTQSNYTKKNSNGGNNDRNNHEYDQKLVQGINNNNNNNQEEEDDDFNNNDDDLDDGLFYTNKNTNSHDHTNKNQLPNLVNSFLQFFLDIAEDSRSACKLFESRLSDSLLHLIQSTLYVRCVYTQHAIELWWTLLEAYSSSLSISTISSSSSSSSIHNIPLTQQQHEGSVVFDGHLMDVDLAVNVLTKALNYKLETGNSQVDKECRNNLIIILSLLLKISAKMVNTQTLPSSSSSFAGNETNESIPATTTTTSTTSTNILSLFHKHHTLILLVAYSCMAETTGSPTTENAAVVLPVEWKPMRGYFCSTSELDVELKRLLWMTLSDILFFIDNNTTNATVKTTHQAAVTQNEDEMVVEGGEYSSSNNGDNNDNIDDVKNMYIQTKIYIAASPLISVMLTYLDTDPDHYHNQQQQQNSLASMSMTLSSINDRLNTNTSNNNNNNNSSLVFSKSSPTKNSHSHHTPDPKNTDNTTINDGVDNNDRINHSYINKLSKYQLQEIRIQAIKFLAIHIITNPSSKTSHNNKNTNNNSNKNNSVMNTSNSSNTNELLKQFINLQGFGRILAVIQKYTVSVINEHKLILYTCLSLFQSCLQQQPRSTLATVFAYTVDGCLDIRRILPQLETDHDDKDNNVGSYNNSNSFMYMLLWIIEKNPDQSIRTLAAHIISILCTNNNNDNTNINHNSTAVGITSDMGNIEQENRLNDNSSNNNTLIKSPSHSSQPSTYLLPSSSSSYRYYQNQFEIEGGIQLCLSLLEMYASSRLPVVGNKAGLNTSNHFTSQPMSQINNTTNTTSNIGNVSVHLVILEEEEEEVSSFWVTIIMALWKGIINHNKNLFVFGTCTGIDILLNVLETTTSYCLRNLILRALCDIFSMKSIPTTTTATMASETTMAATPTAAITSNELDPIKDIVHDSKYQAEITSSSSEDSEQSHVYLTAIFHAWKSNKTFRSAVQLLTHCWLDEESRWRVTRFNGVIEDVLHPLGHHTTITALTDKINHDNNSNNSSYSNNQIQAQQLQQQQQQESSKSITVAKLNAAIVQARKSITSHGMILHDIHDEALLQADMRGVLSNILYITGVFDNNNNDGVDDDKYKGGKTNKVENKSNNRIINNEGNHSNISNNNNNNKELENKMVMPPSNGVNTHTTNNIYDTTSSLLQQEEILQYIENASNRYTAWRLAYNELQVLSLAKRYAVLKQMESWSIVKQQLYQKNITAIESDHIKFNQKYNFSLEVTRLVQREQKEILLNYQMTQLEDEKKLHESILFQRQNDKKSESLKNQSKLHNHAMRVLKTKKLKSDNYVAPMSDDNSNNNNDGNNSNNYIRNNNSTNGNMASYDDLKDEDSSIL